MFCVCCGKDIDVPIEGMCPECYMSRRQPIKLPNKLQILVCKHCEGIRIHGQWEDSRDFYEVLERIITENIEYSENIRIRGVSLNIINEYEHEYHVEVEVSFEISTYYASEIRGIVTVRKSYGMCPTCSRKVSNYYTAILQIRGEKPLKRDEIEEILKFIRPLIDVHAKDFFVTSIEETRGGVDLKISNFKGARTIAKRILQEYGGSYNESYSLYGHKDGEELWRVTVLVRIPNYRRGDIIVYKNKVYAIERIKEDELTLIELSGEYKKVRMKSAIISKSRAYRKAEVVHEAIVVSEDAKELMVLDPVSYYTVEIIKPPGYRSGRKSVYVARIDGEIYIYPDDLTPHIPNNKR